MKHKFCFLFIFIFTSCSFANAESNSALGFIQLRDSLDDITIKPPVYHCIKPDIILKIYNQKQWDNLGITIQSLLNEGKRNINIIVKSKKLKYGDKLLELSNLNYPDANVRVHGNNTMMIPYGSCFKKTKKTTKKSFYAYPYLDFNWDDAFFDQKGNLISLYEESFTIDTEIEEVESEGYEIINNTDGTQYKIVTRIWRFRTDLPDLSEDECKNFYILLTRNWTSMRHRVVRVNNGYLYFELISDEAPTLLQKAMSPNSDMEYYKTHPRCTFFNSPIGNHLYVKGGVINIPIKYKKIIAVKEPRLIKVSNTKLNSLEISGFNVTGSGKRSCISISNSVFSDQLWIRDNSFKNLIGSSIVISDCENVCIYNNTILKTRINAISSTGKRISIWHNTLRDIGYMYQTMAISFAGTDIHIFENIIEDFNYSAIACGDRTPSAKAPGLTYIIENNIIRFSLDYAINYKKHTVADGGGIYIGPQNSMGIIRNNVIDNIIGISSNRGIFLDDGAKNLAIYGNLIMRTDNCFDIDLRYDETYKNIIPDHNINNKIFHNIMTGGYRFQDAGYNSLCKGGQNLLLGIGNWKKTIVDLTNKTEDITFEGSKTKDGHLFIPNVYKWSLDSLRISTFIRNYIDIGE